MILKDSKGEPGKNLPHGLRQSGSSKPSPFLITFGILPSQHFGYTQKKEAVPLSLHFKSPLQGLSLTF